MTRPTFDDYVAERGRVLLGFAYVLCGDRHFAEDLVQEVLFKAHRRWSAIEAQNPEAYLKQALVRTHLSWARRRASSEVPTATFPEEPVTRGFDDGHASRDELWAMLATLPRTQRAVLVLRYFEDLDDARIAELVGVSSSTVRVHAHRGLQALRETLRARADEAPTNPGLLADVRRGAAQAARRRRIATAAGIATIVTVVLLLVALPFVWSDSSDRQPIVPQPSLTGTPSNAPSGLSPSGMPESGTDAAGAKPSISDLAGQADGLRVTMTFTVNAAVDTGPFTCTLRWAEGTNQFPCTAGANTQTYDVSFTGEFELYATVTDKDGVRSDQADTVVTVPPIDPPSVTDSFADLDGGQWYIYFLVAAATGDHPQCAVDFMLAGTSGSSTHLDNQACGGGMRFPVSATGSYLVWVTVYSADWRQPPQQFQSTVTVGP